MEGMWCTVIRQTFASIRSGCNNTWGPSLEMCHIHEQLLLIFWTNYLDVLVFVISAAGRGPERAKAAAEIVKII